MAAAVYSNQDSDYFNSAPMRRSHSHSNLGSASLAGYHHMAADLSNPYAHPPTKSFSDSDHSSAPSSPRTAHIESADASYTSTPSSNLSIASDYEEALSIDESPEGHFSLPPFTADKLYLHPQIRPDDNLEPPPSPRTGDSYTVSPAEQDSSVSTSRPDSPELSDHAEDDTAVVSRPSRQVDYLSHEWREEDIWSSWRYIISKRGEFPNSARLENASWRTWMKAKNNLKTISPETLNWLKDYDVTWLYGPLQSGKHNAANKTGPPSVSLSKSSSLVNLDKMKDKMNSNKKPILKKRSMSEIMLQRSLSTASLVKQAAAAVHAQEYRSAMRRPNVNRANTDYISLSFSSRRMSHETSSVVASSTDSSSITSPNPERRHIHFNEQVEQCIAVDVKGDDADDLDMDMDLYGDESDSDDGVMMKRVRSKRRPSTKKRTQKKVNIEGKIIAMLPSTTLKYQGEDSPDSQDSAMKHSTRVSRSPVLSPSSSQETLRPSKSSTGFFFDEDEDEDDLAPEIQMPTLGWLSPPSDSGASGLHRSTSSNSLLDEPAGMRRTPSGMFMPCEETETSSGEGIFGRVIDTVNTARDIAHVIWNVGWRK
ncbi:hypothetical protein M441DRAFT_149912 [Trichoderma asperellum CBS 433.97]|uniref:Nitrogen regulatory protein areA GATA-like domain-containing protein n=1 Tax=Trichoderma asperellum (strain ATCC 204424 / CBS 433.97 / NBRC 101777) TaxID=1042311 RepID=A0A2T3YWU1_TRIA4|nr:hypothetical protein M441DRAFT_149912 [Trichoderma asperellum CBS 433.97]PTB37022.1 hypothetical protein M441DRAFT_149912 [Trichoderma asperellum CBS 433.97]